MVTLHAAVLSVAIGKGDEKYIQSIFYFTSFILFLILLLFCCRNGLDFGL